jgi:hypothetical protein
LNTPRVLLQSPPPTWRETFSGFVNRTMLQLGKHVHSWTCKKPPAGYNRCRGAMPQATNEKTQSKQLELTGNIKTKDHKVIEVTPKTKRNHLYLNVDGRIIVWELKRPLLQKLPTPPISFHSVTNKTFKPSENTNDMSASTLHDFYRNTLLQVLADEGTKEYVPGIQQWFYTLQLQTMHLVYNQINEELDTVNGYMTQTNDVLAAATGCSTNAAHLGSSQQSRNAIYYITKYVTKTKVARGNCLLALAASINAISKSPSKAKDTGTDKRTVQQMLTKVHNMLFRHAEISDTQAALTLLGSPSELTSTAFQYVGAKHVISRVKAELAASKCKTKKRSPEQNQEHTTQKKTKPTKSTTNPDEQCMHGVYSFVDLDSDSEMDEADSSDHCNTASIHSTQICEADSHTKCPATSIPQQMDEADSSEDCKKASFGSNSCETASIADEEMHEADSSEDCKTASFGSNSCETASIADQEMHEADSSEDCKTASFGSNSCETASIADEQMHEADSSDRCKTASVLNNMDDQENHADPQQEIPFPLKEVQSMGPPLLIPVKKLNGKGELEEDTIPCPTAAHWRFRGEALKDLTCAEYFAIIGHRPYTKEELLENHLANEIHSDQGDQDNDKSTTKKRGRKASTRYSFDPTHPLYSTHYQYIKSVQATPVFNIYMPKFPGKPPSPPPKYSPDSTKNYPKRHFFIYKNTKNGKKSR